MRMISWNRVFFFFQAEDGIRDYKVTGVQTCALPIWEIHSRECVDKEMDSLLRDEVGDGDSSERARSLLGRRETLKVDTIVDSPRKGEIGRASCRERV